MRQRPFASFGRAAALTTALVVLSAGRGRAQDALPASPETSPGKTFVVSEEVTIAATSEWAPETPGKQDDAALSGHRRVKLSQTLSREVTFPGGDDENAAIRYLKVDSPQDDAGMPLLGPDLRSKLTAGTYGVRTAGDALEVTKGAGNPLLAAEKDFLTRDFQSLASWRSLREALAPAGLKPGESHELKDSAVLALMGPMLPIARRVVVTLRQAPASPGEDLVFDVEAELEPGNGEDGTKPSLQGTARIDAAAKRIAIQLSADRSETTSLEFIQRSVVKKLHRAIEIRRTIDEKAATAATPTG